MKSVRSDDLVEAALARIPGSDNRQIGFTHRNELPNAEQAVVVKGSRPIELECSVMLRVVAGLSGLGADGGILEAVDSPM